MGATDSVLQPTQHIADNARQQMDRQPDADQQEFRLSDPAYLKAMLSIEQAWG
jgi:hypothetical protein